MFMNTAKPPFNDINVRKAILHGVDRKALIDVALFGLHQPSEGPISSNTIFYTKKVEGMYPYDAEKAKKLLDDAGWKMGSDGIRAKDGQRFSVDFLNFPAYQPIGVALQALLKPLGIEVNVKIFDQPTRVAMSSNGDGHLYTNTVVASDPGTIQIFYHSKNIGALNWSRVSDPAIDAALDNQAKEPDQAKRAKYFEDLQLKIMENAQIYPMYIFARLHGVSSKVQNFRNNALGNYPFFYEMSLA
jgi:peptide/nickel transport system substrate-binding protein